MQVRFKMASFYILIATVLVCCSTETFAQGNSTFQPENNTVLPCNISRTNKSPLCIPRLQTDKSKIKDVLSLQYKPTTNIVKIKVSVVSGNRTGCFPKIEWPWANEIGRTIISLVRRGKDTIFTSPIFTAVLEVGTVEMDIQVVEETNGCLPLGDKGLDQIFDFLLHNLSHSDDSYKLCRAHDDQSTRKYTTYNCCRIARDRNLAVCADYSSFVVTFALPAVIVVFFVSFFMTVPFVLEYIITYQIITFYKTSYSHMSLISIVSKIFFEGREPGLEPERKQEREGGREGGREPGREARGREPGREGGRESGREQGLEPAKSFFRRCVFVGLSLLVFLPDFFGFLWLQILFGVWAVVFVFVCDGGVMEYVDSVQGTEKPALDKKIISVLKAPFSYFFVDMLKFYEHNEYLKDLPESLYGFVVFIISFGYVFISLPFWIVEALLEFFVFHFIFVFGILKYSHISIIKDKAKKFREENKNKELLIKIKSFIKSFIKFVCRCSMRLLTFANIVFFTGMILTFALSLVVGFTLNGEFFGPFVAPIFTLIGYFWKNWKFSVEAKCLQLKTSIIEVCKEKISATKDEQNSDNNGTNVNDQNNPVPTEQVPLQGDEQNSENNGTNVNGQNNPVPTEQVPLQGDGQNSENNGTNVNGQNNPVPTEQVPLQEDEQNSENNGTHVNGQNNPVPTEQIQNDEQNSEGIRARTNVRKRDTKPQTNEYELDELDNNLSGQTNYACDMSGSDMDESETENDAIRDDDTGNGDNPESPITDQNETENDAIRDDDTGNGDNPESPITDQNGEDDHKFIIKFDEHGEAMMSKELYEKIRKEILSLDHLLFYFFRRVIFVGIYAFVLLTVMILARDSGVSESVQVISAIAGVMIPFIFDTIFADHHLSVRTSNNLATKERLEHILKVNKRESNTIFVELVNVNNDKSKKNEEIEQPRAAEQSSLGEQSVPV